MSMPAALQSRRTYAGPPLFSYGFRPFFLVAALSAAFNILLWLLRTRWARSLRRLNSVRSIGTSTRCSTAMWQRRLPASC